MTPERITSDLVRPTVGELSREFLGYGYLIWWFQKNRLLRILSWTTSRVLAGGFALLFFDIVAHTWTQEIIGALRANLWISRIFPILEYLWLLAILAALYTEWNNWKQKKQEVYFVDAIDLLMDKLDKIALGPVDSRTTKDRKDAIVKETLAIARSSFKDRMAVQANFAEVIDGRLKIQQVDPPGCEYALDFAPALGEGGSGYAAEKKAIVYLPSIWLRNAIHIAFDREKRPTEFKPPGIKRNLYTPVEKKYEVYRSILIVPVVWENPASYGVLNFDAKRRDAFSEVDFKVASIYGQLLGLAFKRLETLPKNAV